MNLPFLEKFRQREIVGLDMGHVEARFVRMQAGQTVSRWTYPGSLLEEAVNFREFLKANRLRGISVAVNIEDPSLKIHKIDLPKMPEYDLNEAVRWQMRDVVEGPIEEFVVRRSLIEEYRSGDTAHLSMIAYAVQKKAVRGLISFLRGFGLNPLVVEPQAVSLAAALERIHGFQPGEYYGLIDIGETRSVFLAAGEGRLLFSRPLPGVSGRELTTFIRKELEVGHRKAEDIKGALVGAPGVPEISSPLREKAEAVLAGFHTRVAIEGQRSVDAFALMFRREKVNKLFLAGGGARLSGLEVYLAANLGIPTSVLNPSEVLKMPPESAHLCNVAVGLALHSL